MSTAELPVETIPPQFKMPRPMIGQTVLYFPYAEKNSAPSVITVSQVHEKTITAHGRNGQLSLHALRHIDDPILKTNRHVRDLGAWDFGQKDKEEMNAKEAIAALEARVAALEELVTGGGKDKKKA